MKVWQAIGCAIVSIVLFVGVIIGLVFYATSGITDTADEFFVAANEGNYDRAYSLTSQQLRRATNPDQLRAFIEDYGLDEVTDTSWGSRSINDERGELTGTLTTESGGSIPVEIDLVQENGQWKIVYVNVDTAGLEAAGGGISGSGEGSAQTNVIPSAEYQTDVAHMVSSQFQRSLSDPDFSEFAWLWIDGADMDLIGRQFEGFRPFEREMRMIRVSDPVVQTASELNDNGFLEVSGYYDIDAGRFDFTYEFQVQGERDMKLVAVEANWN